MSEIEILAELRDKDPASLAAGSTPDELRGKTPAELEAFINVLDAHLRSIHQDEDTGELRDKTPAEQTAFNYGLKLRDVAMKRLEEHRAIADVFAKRPKAVQAAMANISRDIDDVFGDVRGMTTSEARDAALRTLADRTAAAHLRSDQKDEVDRQIRRNPDIAKRILVTENEHYRSAFMKLTTNPQAAALLTDEERRAIRSFDEYRAVTEASPGGGYGIPVFIDPSIILTAQGTNNPFLTLARQVDVNTNVWKGVSSAGVSWQFQAELAAVTDNSPTLAQPTVNVYMARGFIPYSIEVGQDYPGFADEMQTLLTSGYNELLIDKFTRGSGSGEPQGLITVLSANTNVRVRIASAGGGVSSSDPYTLWAALPQRYQGSASWMMNVSVNNAIRQLGTANVYHAYTVGLPQGAADRLFDRPVYMDPYMNNTTNSTSAGTEVAVVGDFSNYLIARRGGMSVELVPQIFDITNNRPTGQRGWFAYARIGGGSVNDLGFRLAVNT